MKKITRILLTLFVALSVFTTTAFAEGTSSETTDEKPFNYLDDDIYDEAESLITELISLSNTELYYYATNAYGLSAFATKAYLEAIEDIDLGEFVEFEEDTINNYSDRIEAVIIAKFENVDLKFTCEYVNVIDTVCLTDLKVSEYSGSGNQSLADSIKDAALNTVMGLATVFVMLILISFIISLLRYIPVIQEKFSKENREKKKSASSIENVFEQIADKEELVDDTELVAVITAAICAATNASGDSFVVRSIRKRR